MTLIILFVLGPTYWLVLTSIKTPQDVMARPPLFVVPYISFKNFLDVLNNPAMDFSRFLWNSVVISISSTVLATVVAAFGALSLSRLRFPGRRRLATLTFIAYLVPGSMLFIPMYMLLAKVGLIDTKAGLSIVYISFTLPFVMWMLRGYFQTIPVELEESAMMDGCTRVGAWLRIVLPLAAPGIAAAAIFAFTNAWNEFLFAWVLSEGPGSRTAPVGLSWWIFLDMFFWAQLSAGAVILAIPAVILYFTGQRFIVSGLTGGAVKG
jgi:ABC-type glycerol-3-phosphate transport system permease component